MIDGGIWTKCAHPVKAFKNRIQQAARASAIRASRSLVLKKMDAKAAKNGAIHAKSEPDTRNNKNRYKI